MPTSTTPSGRRYHHNGDFSGEIWIELTADELSLQVSADMPAAAVRISTQDILDIADDARAATEDPNYDADHR